MGFFIYRMTTQNLIESLGEKEIAVAKSASLQIDPVKHLNLKPGDEKSKDYQDMIKYLRQVQEINDLTYIYTFVLNEDKSKVLYVLDADPEKPYKIGDEYGDLMDSISNTFNGTASHDKDLVKDEDGIFLSGYAPIYDAKHNVIAILGVDISAEKVLTKQNELLRQMAFSLLPGILIALLISIVFSRRTSRSLSTLNGVIANMASRSGDLTQRITVKRNA
jgi:methyl-accepting chemotaxis protein